MDGHAVNPGDLNWDALNQFGEVTVYERTEASETVSRCKGVEIALTNKTVFGSEEISQLPDLKYIGVLATGYNVVDTEAAAKAGIVVTNIPAYSTDSVAQMAFAHILEFCSRVQQHSDAVAAGDWVNCPDFTFTKFPLVELAGKSIGIIGFGTIGQRTAQIAAAFGMKVLASARTEKSAPAGVSDFEFVATEKLLAEADFVSLNCPLTPETEELINSRTISLMKESAFLVNTGRGGLVNEADLAEALNSGRIAGAGLDVLSTEPPAADNPLLKAVNCTITPHIAWATREARTRCMNTAVNNVSAFLAGSPVNKVN
jgi:glycerate dehydrogenase